MQFGLVQKVIYSFEVTSGPSTSSTQLFTSCPLLRYLILKDIDS